MKKLVQILFFTVFQILFQFSLYTQNLIPNHNFDKFKARPTAEDQLHLVSDWYCPNATTPDFYVVSVLKGNTNPLANNQDTNGYVGLVFRPEYKYGPFEYCDYYEYVSTKLIQPLKKSHEYVVKCDVFFRETSIYSFNHLGIAFSKDSLNFDHKRRINLEPTNMFNYGALLENQSWVTICNTYKAKGGECFVYLGSYSDKEDLKLVNYSNFTLSDFEYKKETSQKVYMYVDNVIVEALNDNNACQKDRFNINALQVGKTYSIDNIQFEFAKATLLASSYQILDDLTNLLQANPGLKIQINGHTDNIGTDTYNQELSEGRAKAVFDYLVSKKIPRERMKYKGFGSSKPLTQNASKQGRATNRRVEFEVLEK